MWSATRSAASHCFPLAHHRAIRLSAAKRKGNHTMADIRSLERTLLDNLPRNNASIKFLARFLLALYDMWTVNRQALASRLPKPHESNKKKSWRDGNSGQPFCL